MSNRIVVWDFDGVLNANIVDGRFVWADNLAQDWGIDRDTFSAHVFGSGLIRDIVRGRLDLRDAVADWFVQHDKDVDVDDFLDYWFAKDANTDAEMLALMGKVNGRHVIGTNNEARRARYIETVMGFEQKVERVFASGRMGHAKPDPQFFEVIESWSGAERTAHVLIDDTAANVEAARMRGWTAFHFSDQSRNDLPGFLGVRA